MQGKLATSESTNNNLQSEIQQLKSDVSGIPIIHAMHNTSAQIPEQGLNPYEFSPSNEV